MKTLTNESKILFFGQNIGQEYEYKPNNEFYKDKIAFHFIVEKYIRDFECRVIKTPLEDITKEHALEVARMCGFVVTHLIKKGYTKPHFDLSDGNFGVCYYEDYYNYVTYEAAQYLLSKGYAIPFYCPIENRIIPVQEQIDNGWITLKTQ